MGILSRYEYAEDRMDMDVARSIESLSDADRAALLRFLQLVPEDENPDETAEKGAMRPGRNDR